jgi:hypothetical protein
MEILRRFAPQNDMANEFCWWRSMVAMMSFAGGDDVIAARPQPA